jgi:hypothetical protein
MRSWIQDPITHQLIPANEYRRREGTDNTADKVQIIADITPFLSPVTGEVISSRSQLREHNRVNGVTNTADYGPQWFERKAKERADLLTGKSNKKERIETILRAIAEHGG